MSSSRSIGWGFELRVRVCALGTVLLLSAAARANVVINEIHYEEDEKPVPEEFIELYNTGDAPVDLSGWFFSDGLTFAFPPGASIEPGGYVVVAEDPETLATTLGYQGAYGPWEGHLDNDGELVVLRDREGRLVDQVDYDVAFPWPTAAAGRGSSMELIDAALDNDLGSSWRSSGLVEGPPRERHYLISREDPDWRWRKATSEASEPPDAWRRIEFVEDGTWQTGQTSIGFGDDDDNTIVDDMEESYTGLYLRHGFTITGEPPSQLKLGTYVDDGCIIWINGVEVARIGVVDGEHAFDATARSGREARWADDFLENPASYLVEGENIIAIHAMNQRISSNDFSIDIELFTPGEEDFDDDFLGYPTPGARNTVASNDIPPNVRQVTHLPVQPRSGTDFIVTARVTDPDGVASVHLLYQIVPPGDYIPAFLPLNPTELLSRPQTDLLPNPAFEDPANWTAVEMNDSGSSGDLGAGDGTYTVTLPGQPNRTLVRYRLTVADRRGAQVTVPYRDDPSLNFAAFVYDGVPSYKITLRTVHPEGVGYEYPREVMNTLPVYTLITRDADWQQCIGYSGTFQIPKSNEPARDKFNWEGAFVYDGVAYDHVRYRLRQANDRYGGQGKRSFRIRFNKGRYAQLRDNYGKPYPTRWRTINTGKMFDNKRVGNFGLTETINHDLWNLVGVAAPFVHTFQFRVVKGEEEAPEDRNGQFFGDFQGMHLAFEDYDPRFLDAHGLPDGNLYKLKDGQFNGNDLKRNQSRWGPTDDSDFQNIRRNLRPTQTNEWLDSHVNYDHWNRYHAVVEGVRHYDFVPADSHSKNRAWYFEPWPESEFGRVRTLPWDSDASWGPNWNNGEDYAKAAIFSGRGKEPFKMNYRNNMREFVDLVWTEEVINTMIDDLASFVREFSNADRDRFRSAPAQAGTQDFGPIEAKIADMKRFAFVGWSGSTGPTVPAGGRRQHLMNLAAAEREDTMIPATPVVTSPAFDNGDAVPIDQLVVAASDFSDPQSDDFGGLDWRIGEVGAPDRAFDPDERRRFEVPAAWTMELDSLVREVTIPRTVAAPGKYYRVRARFRDATGRTSHWSEPLEFQAAAPTSSSAQAASLRITEIHYHPDADEAFEFIEILNVGGSAVSLDGVRFAEGVELDCGVNGIDELGPGEYAVAVKNLGAFQARYGSAGITMLGEYRGSLANEGERVRLVYGAGETILDFEYSDRWEPLTDGIGYSLVLADPDTPSDRYGDRSSWRASTIEGGSPGRDESDVPMGRQLPGDINQSGRLEIGDAVAIFGHLFLGLDRPLPCGDGRPEDPANQRVLDIDGSDTVDLTDGIRILDYLFAGGIPPALGTECVEMEGCPNACP